MPHAIRHLVGALALFLAVGFAAPGLTQQQRPAPSASTEQKSTQGPGVLALLPGDAVSEHTLQVDGRSLAYTATAGTLDLHGQNGERTAAMFYTAYVLKGA